MATRDRFIPKPQNAQEALFDAMVRHQVGLFSVAGKIRREAVSTLDASEPELEDVIRAAMSRGAGFDTSGGVVKFNRLIRKVRKLRQNPWKDIKGQVDREMKGLVVGEAKQFSGVVKTVLPVSVRLSSPSATALSASIENLSVAGRTFDEWHQNLRQYDHSRINAALRFGMSQGENPNVVINRVLGQKRLRGRGGATQLSRNSLAGVIRTGVNATATQARSVYVAENGAFFDSELYVAVLDGQTTPICRTLDGKVFANSKGPVPPLHIQCRSLRIPLFYLPQLIDRPAKPITTRRILDEYADLNGLDRIPSRGRVPRGHRASFDRFARRRIGDLIGEVPVTVTYEQWLKRQPAAFQDDALGSTRAKLFRRSELSLDRFVDRTGRELTLEELAKRDKEAFEQAGLDPEDF